MQLKKTIFKKDRKRRQILVDPEADLEIKEFGEGIFQAGLDSVILQVLPVIKEINKKNRKQKK